MLKNKNNKINLYNILINLFKKKILRFMLINFIRNYRRILRLHI